MHRPAAFWQYGRPELAAPRAPWRPPNIDWRDTRPDADVLLAIPESEVIRDPAVVRGTVCLWRLHGYEVFVVTDAHREQVRAVLGDRVTYVASAQWLEGVVWIR